jgi:hypothetical protein
MDDFWDFFGFFFWSYVVISLLIVLFAIFADLFRDRSTSGWAKAGWIVLLVFVPFIGAIVYIGTRGSGMDARKTESPA